MSTTSLRDGFDFVTIIGQEGSVPVLAAAPEAHPFLFYSPGLADVATCRSAISRIDGERGVLSYRGTDISSWTAHKFDDVARVLLFGEQLDASAGRTWADDLQSFSGIDHQVRQALDALPLSTDAVNAMMVGVAALAGTEVARHCAPTAQRQAALILAQGAAIFTYWLQRIGEQTTSGTAPSGNSLGHRIAATLRPDRSASELKTLADLTDCVLTLHAEHEQNCSTATVRTVASSRADPFVAVVAGMCAFKGDLHGGASVRVAQMFEQMRQFRNVDEYVDAKIANKERLMGFGHRVYRCWDPRAACMRDMLQSIEPIDETVRFYRKCAFSLIKRVSVDPYFVQRKIFPNPDLLNGIIFRQLGIPSTMNTAMLTVSRTAGWLAHYLEHRAMRLPITRPRQISLA